MGISKSNGKEDFFPQTVRNMVYFSERFVRRV